MTQKTENKSRKETVKSEQACGFYLITPPKIDDPNNFAKILDQVFSFCPTACLQLRLKDCNEEAIIEAAEAIKPVCEHHNVALLLNDHVELADKLGVDGVHLGQGDMPVKEARAILGKEANIGATCHDSMDLAFRAGESGADYVAFGAFFETDTKVTDYRPSPDILTVWDEITELPSVAIGGITPDNCETLIKAGAHFIAVCGAVWNHKDGPVAAAKAFAEKLDATTS